MQCAKKTLFRLDPGDASAIAGCVPLPDDATLAVECPQETWVVDEPQSRAVACCSLWWRGAPCLDGRRIGYIGHYAAARRGAARTLLRHAVHRLAARGCQLAIAPVNGSIWRNYRFVIDGRSRPPFFFEPQNPGAWVGDLTSAGFAPCATYLSAITDRMQHDDPRLPGIERRLHDHGVTFLPLDPTRIGGELNRIHALAHECFRANFLYSEISERAFAAACMKTMERVRPEHIWLAERDETLLGFVFATPDHAQASRGETVDTLILKTMAVRPGRAWAGLGRVLAHEVNKMAVRGGYRKVIHALMREGNTALAYSRRFASPLRRYAVFSRVLA